MLLLLGMLTANIIGILNPIQGGTGTTSITALKNVLNLNLVENQALTTWEGSTSIRTLGVMTGISINGSISCNSGASFNGTVTANKFVGNGSGITGIVSDYATQSVSFVIGGQCFATSTAYGVSDNLGMAGGFYWYGGTVSVNAFTFRVRAVDTGATQPHVAINLNGSYIGETAISTSVQTVTLSTGNTLTNGNFFDMVLMSGGSNGNASTLVVTIWFKPKS